MRQGWTEILPLLFVSSAVLAEAPVAVVRPSSVLLRTGEKVSISVRVGEPGRRVRAAANTGKLEGPDDRNASEQRFTYTPPPTRFPQTALLLFWVEEPRSAPEVAAVQIPLLGHTTLQINTEPDAQVRVQVADASFGPRPADKQGRVDIPIDVPPGALTAQVFAESRDRLTTRSTPLDVPPVNPLAAALSPDPLPTGEDGWLIVAQAGSLDASQLWIEVAGGNAQRATSLPDRTLFRITPGPTSERVSATVGLRNQPGARATAQASVAAAPQRTEIRTLDQRTPSPGRFSTAAAIGGFYAGGSSSGLALAIAGSYTLPWAGERFSLDAEVGFRSAHFSAAITGLGRVDSSLNGVPLELALRSLIWRRGPWAICARLGGGAMPFWTLTRSNFQPSFRQSKLGFEAFVAGQAGYRLGSFEVTGELRGALAPASTPNLDARLGGAVLAFGARYDLR